MSILSAQPVSKSNQCVETLVIYSCSEVYISFLDTINEFTIVITVSNVMLVCLGSENCKNRRHPFTRQMTAYGLSCNKKCIIIAAK